MKTTDRKMGAKKKDRQKKKTGRKRKTGRTLSSNKFVRCFFCPPFSVSPINEVTNRPAEVLFDRHRIAKPPETLVLMLCILAVCATGLLCPIAASYWEKQGQ